MEKRTDPVCSLLAHSWIFSKSDAPGSAGIEPGAGNRCGKERLGVKKGTEKKVSRQKFSFQYHGTGTGRAHIP